MILEIDDWIFDIDLTATMEYSAKEAMDHCDCAYCRNFYATVDDTYPNLRPFLAQFGINVEAPDEMSPMPHSADSIGYDPEYIVIGKIIQAGTYEMAADHANILAETAKKGTYPYDRIPDGHPCFMLYVMDVTMPWVLDEPMVDVVSPANEPSFLRRMLGKRLSRGKKSNIPS